MVTDLDRLTYVGHGTVLIRLAGTCVITDPMLRGGVFPLIRHGPLPDPRVLEAADAVLISHLHKDHLDLPTLRRVPPRTPVVIPRGAGRWGAKIGRERVLELERGEATAVGRLRVAGVPANHNGYRGMIKLRREIETLGYAIEGGGRRVYFAGDTDLFDEMSDLGPVEVALLPVWGWGTSVGEGHLDPAGAAEAVARLRPRVAIPIHWGTLSLIGLARRRPEILTGPPLEFARLVRERAPETEVRVLQPGESTAL